MVGVGFRWTEVSRRAASTHEGHTVPLKGSHSRLNGLRPRSAPAGSHYLLYP